MKTLIKYLSVSLLSFLLLFSFSPLIAKGNHGGGHHSGRHGGGHGHGGHQGQIATDSKPKPIPNTRCLYRSVLTHRKSWPKTIRGAKTNAPHHRKQASFSKSHPSREPHNSILKICRFNKSPFAITPLFIIITSGRSPHKFNGLFEFEFTIPFIVGCHFHKEEPIRDDHSHTKTNG